MPFVLHKDISMPRTSLAQAYIQFMVLGKYNANYGWYINGSKKGKQN
jgi:hypothetical protein